MNAMKNIERKPQTQRVQPFKRIGEFVVGRPLLTREDKQELKVYRESLRMIGEQAREQRAKEPKVQLSIEAWRTYVAERLRFEQFESQATARGETYNPDTQYGLYETLTPENKN